MGARGSRAACPALAAAIFPGLAWHAVGVFQTYVETGPVEPYRDGVEESVFLLGAVAPSSSGAHDVRILRASPIQTSQDVLVAHLRSDSVWRLDPVKDCWSGGYHEDVCCGTPGIPGCFGGIFTHERCCVRAPAGRAYLAANRTAARRAASPLLARYRYGIDEARWEARRLRLRYGTHAQGCEARDVTVPPLPPGFEDNPETGLRAAFAVLVAAGLATRRALQIGTNDGKTLDPLYPLIMLERVSGLGLEADPVFAEMAWGNRLTSFRVNRTFVTPQNIWQIAGPLGPLDVVVADIDSFECPVLEALVDGALRSRKRPPALLHFETNTGVPPPFAFFRGYAPFPGRPEELFEMQLASTSCSLSYAVHAFGARGYDLLFFGYDSIFMRRDLRPHFEAAWGRRFPMDEFECYRRASKVHAVSGPLRHVREWFFRADDPRDLEASLALLRENMTFWSAYEQMVDLPWALWV